MNSFIIRKVLIGVNITIATMQGATAQQTNQHSLTNGLWKGTIQINEERAFNIAIEKMENNGNPKYFFHSIDQNSYNFPIRNFEFQADSLKLLISSLNASISLQVTNTSANGYFTQRNVRFPVKLEHTLQPLQKPNRPQEPAYPLPYYEEDVIIRNNSANVNLAGTITYPKDNLKHPAILLIPGSGPSDRDQSIFGHKNFLVLADILTRNGFIVLRMDDRGCGESTGDFESTSIKDFATDAAGCIQYLKTRKEVSGGQVGVLGHSLGADIAAYLAAGNSDIKFVILMAGSAEMLSTTIIRQTEKIYADNGASADAIALNTDILKAVFTAVDQTTNDSVTMAWITKAFEPLNKRLAEIGERQQALIETTHPLKPETFSHFLSPGMRFDLFYDPTPALLKIKQPVLVLHGEKDIQVSINNSTIIISQLKQYNRNPHTQSKLYPSTNHMFQQCKSCTVDEYQHIEETISPMVLKDIISWLKQLISDH